MEHLDHPSPHFNDAKMARFCSFAPSSLPWGDGGLSFPFILSEIVHKPQPKARRPTNNTGILRIFFRACWEFGEHKMQTADRPGTTCRLGTKM